MTLVNLVDTPMDPSHFERGLSTDAQKLRSLCFDIVMFPDPSAMSSFKGEALQALLSAYSKAQFTNWDGDGGAAVAETTLQFAMQLLALLPSRIPQPEIYPEPDGEIAFEWDNGRRRVFSISVGRDGTLTYAGLMGGNRMNGIDYLTNRLPVAIRAGLESVIAV